MRLMFRLRWFPFAVDVAKEQDIITPELKKAGNALMFFYRHKDAYDLPDYGQIMKLYQLVHDMIQKKAIISAYVIDSYGFAAAVSKMAFGNKLGVSVEGRIPAKELFGNCIGSIVAEVPADMVDTVLEAAKASGLRLM